MANLSTSVLSGPSPSSMPAPPASPPPMSLSHQIGIAILVIAFVLGFPGNLFVVWSVLCRVRRRSVTCLLILNLAMADALVLLSAPLFIRYLVGQKWEFGSVVCKTVHYLCCVNMYASIFLICLMSMDRWLAVTKPFLSQRLRTKKRLLSIMLAIWVMAFLMALPMPFYRSVLPVSPGVPTYLCRPYHMSDAHAIFQYLSETLLGFLLPFTFILFCYISVICRLRSAMFHRKGRGNFLILLIIAAFTIFWMPYHMINILQVIGMGSSSSLLKIAKNVRPNVTAFAFLSSSVNPVLYVFAGSSHIRQAGLGFMAKLFEGTNSETTSTRSTRSSRGSNAEISVFNKLSVKLSRKGDCARDETPDGEETMADKTLITLH